MKMMLKKLLQYGFVATCLLSNAIGMDDSNNDGELLIVGCRPWDVNIQGFNGLETAHFVDRMIQGAPEIVPSTFHHFDINEVGAYSQESDHYNGPLAGKFTEFAKDNPGKFKTIVIDWATYHHIGENGTNTAWKSFETLLSQSGKLIIPVLGWSSPKSIAKAQEVIDHNQLNTLFSSIDICTYEVILSDACFNLLRRPTAECFLSSSPAIIIATKQVAAEEITFKALEVKMENTEAEGIIFPASTVAEIKESIINEVVELSPTTTTTEISIPEGYKEVSFPSLAKIKESLRQGRSTIFSETGDGFNVHSIWGGFHGFSPEAQTKNFDLTMQCMSTSKNGLFGMFRVVFEDSNGIGIQISLRSYHRPEGNYMVTGGTPKKEGFYMVTDPEQLKIMAPVRKEAAERTIFKAPTVDKITEPVLPSTPIITHKETKPLTEEELNYSYDVVLRALAKKYGYENQADKKDVEPLHTFHRANKEHGEQVKLLRENVDRNKEAMNWIDAEFRWRKETEVRDFWSLQAIKDAYTKVARYVEIATNPRRDVNHAEADDRACEQANQYMRDEIEEWLDQDLMQKLVKKGFDWK